MNADTLSFRDFLFKHRRNRTMLWIAAAAAVMQFAILKYFYPYASYIHDDSFNYLETAAKNLSINTYMIGYPMFLRMFSVLTNSDTALVAFQYLLILGSALFLLFTLFYFYHPGRGVQTILFCFIAFNPLFPLMGNLISSDALFLSLSLTWFAILLWIIHQPRPNLIIWHTLVIFLAFTVRYNALIYFFIAVAAFLLSSLPTKAKLAGITSGFIVIGLFVFNTGNLYKELTGTWQYSPFAGWQLANNAMYTYYHVDSADRVGVPERFRALDNMIRDFLDTIRDVKKHPEEELRIANTAYMWAYQLPLFVYRNSIFKKDSTAREFKKWASMGPLYKDYGLYIIQHYPWHYTKYFLWPSATNYYAPQVEYLSYFNTGRTDVDSTAEAWFGYKSRRVFTRTKSLKLSILEFYPILSGMINVVMLLALLSFATLGGLKQKKRFRIGVLLTAIAWLLNAAFTIFTSPAALRFQAFPILLTTTFSVLLVDWIAGMASIKQEASDSTSNQSKTEQELSQETVTGYSL